MPNRLGAMARVASVCLLLAHCRQEAETDGRLEADATFVGTQVCAECHTREFQLWQGSHHDLAMQIADDETVLGDFDSVTFNFQGVTSTFFKSDGKFFVRTDGPDGQLEEYPIAYTFGVEPLQQYLIEFPGGRYQVLSLCWDTRPAEQGGQRWFHLYPDERIDHNDILHWTGPYQTWNHMCAECHSTNLKKNYRQEEDRYETTWSEIDVACESCHGPGSGHVAWAQAAESGEASRPEERKGLVVTLGEGDDVHWVFDGGEIIARRSQPRQSDVELDTCARCHSRRSVIHDEYVHGGALMNTHRPVLLDEVLYYADGQILDEVYVYGSFRQSKMYHEGVGCSDCHNPHSLKLNSAGNGVCRVCHLPETFETPSHHFHPPDSDGASCVECHMPARNYMVVDPRRDHSFRIPRPDLSLKLGTPNACNMCHMDRSVQWAVDAVTKWYGRSSEPHFGEALHAGRNGHVGAGKLLAQLVEDATAPTMARASALALLPGYLDPEGLQAIRNSLRSADPLMRTSALSALVGIEPRARLRLASPLLQDSIRAVRTEAARVLASVPSNLWTPQQLIQRDRAIAEYRQAQLINADRAESHVNLGVLDVELGELKRAEEAYLSALKIAPGLVAASINLADLYRLQDRDEAGEQVLRRALEIAPEDGGVHHSLGLLLARRKRTAEAIDFLARAAELEPGRPRYPYVLAVALQSTGQLERALEVLRQAHERHPTDQDLLVALVTFNRERGALETAIAYANKLVELAPRNAGFRQLLRELQASQP